MTNVQADTDRTLLGEPVNETPTVIAWALGVVAHESARARKLQADIAGDNGRLDDFEDEEQQARAVFDQRMREINGQREAVRTRLANAGRELTAVQTNAKTAHDMAAHACQTNGWDLPAPPPEPPLNTTGLNPVLNDTRPQPIVPCESCGRQIHRTGEDSWVHTEAQTIYCAGDDGPFARPADPTATAQLPPNPNGELIIPDPHASPTSGQQIEHRTGNQPTAKPKRGGQHG